MGAEWLNIIAAAGTGAATAIILFRWIFSGSLKQERTRNDIACQRLLSDAEIAAKRIRDDAEYDIKRHRRDVELREQELQKSLERLAQESQRQQSIEMELQIREAALAQQKTELEELKSSYLNRLQEVGSLNQDALKAELISQIESTCEQELKTLQQNLRDQTDREIESMAREMLITAMQRVSTTPATEATATIVDLPSEDMKGRIIGREGRNIRSFEAVTGTTLMIDETPDSVLISAFDPVKREIARTALESLLKDGRIHPSTIEAAHERAKTDIQKNVQSLGEEAMTRLKLKPAHSEILKLLGQLHFRLSLNQNSLEHSIEVAYIASMLASELGLDPVIAKRAALFHDIGKAIDHEFEGSHALIAGKMLRRYNEDPRVVNAVEASHEEVPPESIYAPLVTIADRISAMRPGARSDSLDSYVDRVKTLERIAKGFEGVKDAFALQAGREIRIIVEPSQLTDQDSRELARSISREIESSMNYPSTIKITVIREQRFCATAK